MKTLVLYVTLCLAMGIQLKNRVTPLGPCLPEWINDGICNAECALPKYNWDENDCLPPGCLWNLIGGLLCTEECNVKILRWDGGDCKEVCEPEWIGDGYCDTFCYNEENQFDLGDCDAQIEQQRVCFDEWIGDGACDQTCNVERFRFDGGDCDKA